MTPADRLIIRGSQCVSMPNESQAAAATDAIPESSVARTIKKRVRIPTETLKKVTEYTG